MKMSKMRTKFENDEPETLVMMTFCKFSVENARFES